MELLESDGPRPRQARYQAALRPDVNCSVDLKALSDITASLIHHVREHRSAEKPRAHGLHEFPYFPNKLTVMFAPHPIENYAPSYRSSVSKKGQSR
jgi:hypothetical protein